MPQVPPPPQHQHVQPFRSASDGWADSTALWHNSISWSAPSAAALCHSPRTPQTSHKPLLSVNKEQKERLEPGFMFAAAATQSASGSSFHPQQERWSCAWIWGGNPTLQPQIGAAARGDAAPGAAAHSHAGGCPGVGCGHSTRLEVHPTAQSQHWVGSSWASSTAGSRRGGEQPWAEVGLGPEWYSSILCSNGSPFLLTPCPMVLSDQVPRLTSEDANWPYRTSLISHAFRNKLKQAESHSNIQLFLSISTDRCTEIFNLQHINVHLSLSSLWFVGSKKLET